MKIHLCRDRIYFDKTNDSDLVPDSKLLMECCCHASAFQMPTLPYNWVSSKMPPSHITG